MDKIDLPFFYQLGFNLHKLATLAFPGASILDSVVGSMRAQDSVSSLLDRFPGLTVCRKTSEELCQMIDSFMERFRSGPFKDHDFKEAITDWALQSEVQELASRAKDLETLLLAELQTLASYHVTQTGIYSVPDLIANAENSFPLSVKKKLSPQAVHEVRESGRCLAFGISTACAFHILRATELVMHDYYLAICQPAGSTKKLSNWGAYIKALRDSSDVDAKRAAEMLQQLKDHDRNPIMHPETVVTPDDAHTLFELGQGTIMAMAGKLPQLGEEELGV